MASGLRTKAEALALAGCDFLVVVSERRWGAQGGLLYRSSQGYPLCGAAREWEVLPLPAQVVASDAVLALPALPAPQGPKVLTALNSTSTLDGYNTGLSAAEEMPGGVEPRLSRQRAMDTEFAPAELEVVDGELKPRALKLGGITGGGKCEIFSSDVPARLPSRPTYLSPPVPPLAAESRFEDLLGMAARELLAEGVQRLVDDANRLEPAFLNLAGGQE